MAKRRNNLGGSRNNLGSKSWRKRVFVGDGQFVRAGSIIMKVGKRIRLGNNVYRAKNVIHSRVDGVVRVRKDKVEVVKKEV